MRDFIFYVRYLKWTYLSLYINSSQVKGVFGWLRTCFIAMGVICFNNLLSQFKLVTYVIVIENFHYNN